MGNESTTEKKVERAILQKGGKVRIGDREYEYPSPTLGTLYMVSALISDIPEISDSKDTAAVVGSASCSRSVAKIIATLIIGAKELKKTANKPIQRLLSAIKLKQSPLDALTGVILDTCTPREALNILVELLGESQLPDFFVLTTFLRDASLTRPTKVVETVTTAPGRS